MYDEKYSKDQEFVSSTTVVKLFTTVVWKIQTDSWNSMQYSCRFNYNSCTAFNEKFLNTVVDSSTTVIYRFQQKT